MGTRDPPSRFPLFPLLGFLRVSLVAIYLHCCIFRTSGREHVLRYSPIHDSESVLVLRSASPSPLSSFLDAIEPRMRAMMRWILSGALILGAQCAAARLSSGKCSLPFLSLVSCPRLYVLSSVWKPN